MRQDIRELESSLDSIPIESSLNDIDDLLEDLTAENIGLDSIIEDIDDFLEEVEDTGIDKAIEEINSLDESFQEIDDFEETLFDAKESLKLLDNYFDNTLVDDTERLETNALLELGLDLRLFEALLRTARVFDNLIDLVEDIGDIWNSSINLDLSLQEEVESMKQELLGLTSSSAIDAGGYHYAFNIAGTSSLTDRSLRDSSKYEKGDGVYVDKEGKSYDDEICLQNDCITTTIENLNSEDVGEAKTHIGSEEEESSMGFSREQAFALLYAIPALIALIGLLSLISCCPSKCCKSWTKWPSCVHMCCITVAIPFILLLVGGILFPFLIVITDICQGGINVGYQYVSGSARNLCQSSLGGTWMEKSPYTSSVCRVDITDSESVDIPILQIYQTALGSCEAHDDPFKKVYADLGDSFDRIPEDELEAAVLDKDPDEVGAIREPLADVLRDIARNSSKVITAAVSDLSDDLGCPEINNMIGAFRDSFCCDIGTALYWWISSWYIIALAMCFCGCPASFFGYKRFAKELWGYSYRDATRGQHRNESTRRDMESSESNALDTPRADTEGGFAGHGALDLDARGRILPEEDSYDFGSPPKGSANSNSGHNVISIVPSKGAHKK
eukprot:gb/GECG01002550.1/.p1 GENE.gb/GECG01002550.1/~~gb/GECG01002550.1/.p1  ORF type:complete len:617 (+),score=91.56 gb/GECG01002550.1/:1-1851(+)